MIGKFVTFAIFLFCSSSCSSTLLQECKYQVCDIIIYSRNGIINGCDVTYTLLEITIFFPPHALNFDVLKSKLPIY